MIEMKKRLCSIFLAMFLAMCVFPLCSISFAATSEDDTEALTHLKNLGILSQEITGDEIMTRGDFAKVVYNIAGKNHSNWSVEANKTVETEDSLMDAIRFCTQNGYMIGDEEGIRPDSLLTYIEGMTIIVRLLNYGEYAKTNKDLVRGYYRTADDIGLLKGVEMSSIDTFVSSGNAAVMLYNALTFNAMEIAEISDELYHYRTDDVIFAYKVLGLNYQEGIMTANGYVDVTGNDDFDQNTVIIDGQRYRCEFMREEGRFYVGQYVSVFYDDNANLISVAPTGRSKVVHIQRDDFSKFSNNKLEYYQNDKLLKTSIASKAAYLKNGEVVMDFKATEFEETEYADLTLIDSDGVGGYEYVIVNIYKTFVINAISSSGILTSLDNVYNLDLGDSSKEILVYNANGEQKSVDNLEVNYIVSAVEGKNFIYVIYANTMTSGLINTIREQSITINDLIIDVPNGVAEKLNDISVGNSVTAYFDFAGRLVWITQDTTGFLSMPHGFLVDAALTEGFSSSLSLKIFNNLGEMQVYELSDRVRINGESYQIDSLKELPAIFKNEDGSLKNVIILFELKDGYITSLTFPKTYLNSGEDGLIQTCFKEKARVTNNGTLVNSTAKPDKTYFSGKEFVNANTEVFIIPEDMTDEEAFLINKRSQIPVSTTLTWDLYHLSKNNGFVDIAVIYGNIAKSEYDNQLSVVRNVCKTVDANGVQRPGITVYTSNGETVVIAKEDFLLQEYILDSLGNKTEGTIPLSELKPGDVVRLAADSKGYLRWGERIYEAKTKTFKGSFNSGAYSAASLYVTSGYIAFNKNSLMRLADSKSAAYASDSDILKLDGFIYSSAKIMIVENLPSGLSITTGDASDIHIGDYIIYQSRAGVGAYLIVFKE